MTRPLESTDPIGTPVVVFSRGGFLDAGHLLANRETRIRLVENGCRYDLGVDVSARVVSEAQLADVLTAAQDVREAWARLREALAVARGGA